MRSYLPHKPSRNSKKKNCSLEQLGRWWKFASLNRQSETRSRTILRPRFRPRIILLTPVERVTTVNLGRDSFGGRRLPFKQPAEIDNIQFPSFCSYGSLLLVWLAARRTFNGFAWWQVLFVQLNFVSAFHFAGRT